MNKAKFMLLGIGVVCLVGVALAFKAQAFSGNKFCTDLQDVNCPGNAHYITNAVGMQLHCTSVANSSCIATLTVVLVD